LEPAALSQIQEDIKRATAVVVGSGLGTLAHTRDAVVELARTLAKTDLPVLFDADGLKAMATERELLRNHRWIVTPHAKEFEILTGVDLLKDTAGRAEEVKRAAKELGCTVLLKSYVDVIASPDGKVALNQTGNPGMTVGGTGDVLTGIVGAFLSQGAEPFRAAVAGVWVCGRAGDLCLKEKGYEFIASDVIEKLPEVFKEVRRR